MSELSSAVIVILQVFTVREHCDDQKLRIRARMSHIVGYSPSSQFVRFALLWFMVLRWASGSFDAKSAQNNKRHLRETKELYHFMMSPPFFPFMAWILNTPEIQSVGHLSACLSASWLWTLVPEAARWQTASRRHFEANEKFSSEALLLHSTQTEGHIIPL